MPSWIELTADDGHRFASWVAEPLGKARGAVVVAQEIFGVNAHIRAVTESYAADGYLAVAPALFDRAQRGFETGYTPEDIATARKVMQGLTIDDAMKDLAATLSWAAAGRVGVTGFCWGGTVAWVAAARLDGLACAVPYYGGGMPGYIGEAPRCPVMMHFGEHDTMPSAEQARLIAAAHPSAIAHFYDAGHGFNCDQRASFDAAASALARSRTLEFFAKHLG
jgi:carboxymethylenebutenolidase